jgi:hypothetical protein
VPCVYCGDEKKTRAKGKKGNVGIQRHSPVLNISDKKTKKKERRKREKKKKNTFGCSFHGIYHRSLLLSIYIHNEKGGYMR